ncbi:class I SAM-dependent methyltransferase [Xenorhabdus szentirmaii]|uniref:Methyltransferase domain-containing protein n=2 Tax=Xenorhabdus szentirmaii TaxID=290112 RepID=W1IZE2_9GAMM|nr:MULTISPECIES: class I SAM-dependent methyltransferase [Xenorhabdus]MBD2781673.1 class I SAM-dependent methyltransferase [Xenorhabdus sp. 38]MBD2802385.1 class I SAM-dependent methyltransferase [Xenorhabdus sp. M]MBD2804416.1 class I SAM-dependent methyltransferase [Xenorhabdus sp. ZM]MBD2819936.1 class I SAM-dependent methyltransferase [Xenorhabdus sp. 42]PHM34788.1 SAM-dependent methyltransferase [Xenorhabdus szentirmaii DSM 16338]
MNTNWMKKEVSHLFDQYDDYLEERLGYTPLIENMKESLGQDISVLDYGCGGGKVSRRLVAKGIRKVTGVDISQTMVDKASSHIDRGNSSYHQIRSGVLDFSDGTFDAAISCYVLINVTEKSMLLNIAKEIYRTLKNNGIFYILDTNPDSSGIKFSSFINGEQGKQYSDGESKPVYLNMPGGSVFKILDTCWHKETYYAILNEAGFKNIELFEHCDNESDKDIGDAQNHPPFVMFKAIKC